MYPTTTEYVSGSNVLYIEFQTETAWCEATAGIQFNFHNWNIAAGTVLIAMFGTIKYVDI